MNIFQQINEKLIKFQQIYGFWDEIIWYMYAIYMILIKITPNRELKGASFQDLLNFFFTVITFHGYNEQILTVPESSL
jgi:hypothetical protein